MLTLQEIITNEKTVAFEFGGEPFNVTYRPFAMGEKQYKRFLSLTAAAVRPAKGKKFHLPFVKRHTDRDAYEYFLGEVLSSWDLYDNGVQLEIRDGLKRLPLALLAQLFVKMLAEVKEANRSSLDELQKKS